MSDSFVHSSDNRGEAKAVSRDGCVLEMVLDTEWDVSKRSFTYINRSGYRHLLHISPYTPELEPRHFEMLFGLVDEYMKSHVSLPGPRRYAPTGTMGPWALSDYMLELMSQLGAY